MKNKLIVFVFIIGLQNSFAQDKMEFHPEIRLSWFGANSGPSNASIYEFESFNGALRNSYLTGFNLCMLFPTKFEHFSWIAGTFYFEGTSDAASVYYSKNSEQYGGVLYFGPQLSTNFKFINLEGYIAGGVFSISDEFFVKDEQQVYSSLSKYTAPGIKSGFNLKISLKNVFLFTGFNLFTTSAKESTLLYKAIDFGVGYMF